MWSLLTPCAVRCSVMAVHMSLCPHSTAATEAGLATSPPCMRRQGDECATDTHRFKHVLHVSLAILAEHWHHVDASRPPCVELVGIGHVLGVANPIVQDHLVTRRRLCSDVRHR